jgi:hypothetical protein
VLSSRVHSVAISLRWRDQGWGNCKGNVYLVAKNKSTSENPDEKQGNSRFGGGRQVCGGYQTQHDETSLILSFAPKKDESYSLWYSAGAGGGHTLTLRDLRMHSLLFDGSNRCVGNNYCALVAAGILQLGDPSKPLPLPSSLLDGMLEASGSLRSLPEHSRHSVPGASFFRCMGIQDHSDESLTAVEDILQQERLAHNKSYIEITSPPESSYVGWNDGMDHALLWDEMEGDFEDWESDSEEDHEEEGGMS